MYSLLAFFFTLENSLSTCSSIVSVLPIVCAQRQTEKLKKCASTFWMLENKMVQLQVSLTVVVLLLCSILVQAENTEELDSFLVAMQNAKANNGTPLAIDFEYATFFSELRAFHENTFEEVEICTEMMEQLQLC